MRWMTCPSVEPSPVRRRISSPIMIAWIGPRSSWLTMATRMSPPSRACDVIGMFPPLVDVVITRPVARGYQGKPGSSGFHDVVADCVTDDLYDGTHAELTHDVRPVGLDGPDADPEHLRHLLVALAFGNELDDLARARSQSVAGLAAAVPPPDLRTGPAESPESGRNVPGSDFDGRDQLARGL